MKKILAFFALTFFAFSTCTVAKKTSFERDMMKAYFYDFKIIYFKSLLSQAFNRSQEIQEILKFDRSGYGEVLLSEEDYVFIDSLVAFDNRVMIRDSLARANSHEGHRGKRVFDYALGKYQSKWLDSLSKVRFRIQEKEGKDDVNEK